MRMARGSSNCPAKDGSTAFRCFHLMAPNWSGSRIEERKRNVNSTSFWPIGSHEAVGTGSLRRLLTRHSPDHRVQVARAGHAHRQICPVLYYWICEPDRRSHIRGRHGGCADGSLCSVCVVGMVVEP